MKDGESRPTAKPQEPTLPEELSPPTSEETPPVPQVPQGAPVPDLVTAEAENPPPAGDTEPETPEESDDGRGFVGSFQDMLGRIIHKGESGIKRATDLKIPKEVIAYGKEQMGSLRKEMVGIVGNEVKSFLSSINLGQELVKIFTYLTFEVKMQIRLVPSEKGGLEIQPKTKVKLVESDKEKGG